MGKKFKLLLLDANIVIELWRLGIWDPFLSHCDVYLARTIFEQEALFYVDDNQEQQHIDWEPYRSHPSLKVFDVLASDILKFKSRFPGNYIERMDPGEAEALAYLDQQTEDCRICSADHIVYKVLGNLRRSAQGISLQEILDQIGLRRTLARQFTREFREQIGRAGFADSL